MALYKYVALRNNKELFESCIEAANERNARDLIRKAGYIPVKVFLDNADYQVRKSASKSNEFLFLSEKRLFTITLQSMLSSGIPVVEALSIMEKNLGNYKLRKIVGDVKEKIIAGDTFTQAMECYEKSFGEVYLKLCRAGEMSGELDIVLDRLSQLLQKQALITDKIISASVYPVIIVIMLFGLLGLFGAKVFPALLGAANMNGIEVPVETSMLVSLITFLQNYWWLIIIFVCGIGYGVVKFINTPAVKKSIDAFLLDIPVFGNFVRYRALANFTAVLYVAYESGVPITECITMACDSIENDYLRERCSVLEKMIYSGKPFSEAAAASGIMPPDFLSMIVIGEKAGKLGQMFKELSDNIDKRVFAIINNLSTLVGPAFLVILGVVVGFVLLAFLKFYYGMLGAF